MYTHHLVSVGCKTKRNSFCPRVSETIKGDRQANIVKYIHSLIQQILIKCPFDARHWDTMAGKADGSVLSWS